jgi:tRNA A-37 threonylcarbamoyl transferase component Bud32
MLQFLKSPASGTGMTFSSLANFEDYLIQQQLVGSSALSEAARNIRGTGPAAIKELIQELERRMELTGYQSAILLKNETEGLRVGAYKLLYRNASGSFARVFRGCSVQTGEMMGLKVLRQRYANDPRAVNLFKREGELGRRLKHKNIVPIYEVGSDGGQHYLTMEFVEGGNLKDILKIRGKFPVEEATKYITDLAEGLEYALSMGFTHRDLKLSNALLSAQRVAKLVDFGLAGGEASGVADEADRAVEYGTLEKFTGAPDGDPRSDLYFLGCMYYEMVSGQPPYPATKNIEERRQIGRYRNIRPIESVLPSLPRDVAEIIDRLLRTNPHERYQTPTELLRDLRKVLGTAGEAAGGESPGSGSGANPIPAAAASSVPTILCIEGRPTQQDRLREYFTKHGYRVLMLSDTARALHRLSSLSVSGVLVTCDALSEDVAGQYEQLKRHADRTETPLVLALSTKRASLLTELPTSKFSKVLAQPVTLRDLRDEIEALKPTAK